jgi:hypothetical protein
MSTHLKEIKCHCCEKEAHCFDKHGIFWNARCLLNYQKKLMPATKKKLPTYEGEKIC